MISIDKGFISWIESMIQSYSTVLIWQDNTVNFQHVFNSIINSKSLIITVDEKQCKEYIGIKTLSKEEMCRLSELYRLYENSDKLMLLTDGDNYGSILNYVKTGMMTFEETLEALLG